ncbi:MAG: DUF2130 domain-containing protein [Bacteroidetes bacterium]|nr:DUF2130 domain-containing protein [Bacteroidota bacterium]
MKSTLICPKCSTEINIEKAIFDQLAASQQKELQRKEKELEAQYRLHEEKVNEKELELENRIASQEKEINSLLKQREIALRESLKVELNDELKLELDSQKNRLEEQKEQIRSFKLKELELLREKEVLEQSKADIELTLQRKLTEQKIALEEKIRKQEQEAGYLRMQEKDELISNLNRQVDDMKRKMEQGSMQSQGEILEIELIKLLAEVFPYDEIKDVPKGVNGADVIQVIKNKFQQSCGTIIYEAKRTKVFSPTWLDKLKSDQRTLGADIAVLVSEVLPKGMEQFGLVNGVWVCSFREVSALSLVLRESLMQIQDVKSSEENKNDKMTMLYDYLTSREFSNLLQAVVDGFVNQKATLEREKRSLQSLWKEREKLIEQSAQAALAMYGGIKAIAGNAIEKIEELELPEPAFLIDGSESKK